MMKNRLLRPILSILCVCAFLLPTALNASADNDVEKYLLGISPLDIGEAYDYRNDENLNRVCVIDEDELLGDKKRLVELLKPMTDYGTMIFWSCSLSKEEQEKQINKWQDGEYAEDSLIITVNLEQGNYNLYSSGAIYRGISKDRLQEITDSLNSYANEGDFDTFARTGFLRAYSELTGEEMTEPPTEVPIPDDEAVRYTNPDTGYQVMIRDDAGLLTEDEKDKLVGDMQPITAYGHIVFWSTNERAPDAEIQAREMRASYYGRESGGIFSVNMANRKIVFHADGSMYDAVSASDARSITDNVSEYASSKEYYNCAKEAYRQVYLRLQGMAIAEPMRYTSSVIYALMLAFVIIVGLAFGPLNPLSKRNKNPAKLVGSGKLLASEPTVRKTGSRQRTWVTILYYLIASIGSGGGSSDGGGSSGGGGGSSGGGGGGSSSF